MVDTNSEPVESFDEMLKRDIDPVDGMSFCKVVGTSCALVAGAVALAIQFGVFDGIFSEETSSGNAVEASQESTLQ
jgi:hypothetical protein